MKLKLPARIKSTLDGNASTSDGAGNIIANYYSPNHNPVFTGTPQAPTANIGTNNNQISTTAFVQNEINQTPENNISDFARTLLDDSDAETARQTLNALGKDKKAVNSTTAEKDSDGNIISEKYLPKVETISLTIPLEGWTKDWDDFFCDFQVENLTANDIVNINLAPESQTNGILCGLCPTVEIFDGYFRLRAKEIPTAEIFAEYYILKGASIGKSKSLGNVNTSTSQRVIIYQVPSQVDSLTFNANEIVLSGNFENLIDAGIYTAYATPTSNFMFDDNSTDAKIFTVTVEKAEQNISLDKNSLELENILMSDTVKVNRLGDGIISATSSDENIVTVENVDSEITVTAISTGNAIISIHVAESKNYLAAEINLPVKSFMMKTLENFEVRAMLIGLNHNVEIESDGENSAHFILKTALVDSNYNNASASGAKYFQHNTTLSSNVGGWTESNLRQNICTDIYNALPDDWKSVIAPCSKFTEEKTDDEIFLLSEFEVFGKISYSNSAEENFQAQYEYFRNGNSKIWQNNDSACHWWLRSAQTSNDTSFCRVNPNGTVGTYNARYSLGIVPAFMVR